MEKVDEEARSGSPGLLHSQVSLQEAGALGFKSLSLRAASLYLSEGHWSRLRPDPTRPDCATWSKQLASLYLQGFLQAANAKNRPGPQQGLAALAQTLVFQINRFCILLYHFFPSLLWYKPRILPKTC